MRHCSDVNRTNVVAYLDGLSYPATTADILAYAQVHGADIRVITMLRKLPNQHYCNIEELMKAYTETLWQLIQASR